MYEPIKDGIPNTIQSVVYTEIKPTAELTRFVHCFWELKTSNRLDDDFYLHVLPDACINILLDQINTKIAGITSINTTFTALNLGKEFHYVGVQFLPGAWQGNQDEIIDRYVGTDYKGELPLVDINNKISGLDFLDQQVILSDLIQNLKDQKIVAPNEVTEKILANLDNISSVNDMSIITGLSSRQLQRVLKSKTGFSPHDLLKVLRLQNSFRKGYLSSFADQSHFIHSFKKITGYTPKEYIKKFNV